MILFRLEAARRAETQGAGRAANLRSGLDVDCRLLRECGGPQGWPLLLDRAGAGGAAEPCRPSARLLLRVESALKRQQTEQGAGSAFEQQPLVSGNLYNVHLLSSKRPHHLPFMDTL